MIEVMSLKCVSFTVLSRLPDKQDGKVRKGEMDLEHQMLPH